MKHYLVGCLVLVVRMAFSQSQLDLKTLMKGQDFIGHWPEEAVWNIDGSKCMFRWNKDGKDEAEPFEYTVNSGTLQQISEPNARDFIPYDRTQSVYPNQLTLVQQSLVLTDRKSLNSSILFQSNRFLSDLTRWSATEATVRIDGDFYRMKFNSQGCLSMIQATAYAEPKKSIQKDSTLLEKQQIELFQFIRDQSSAQEKEEKSRFETVKETHLPVDFKDITGRYFNHLFDVVLLREDAPSNEKATEFMQYITADGFTNTQKARSKVGAEENNQKMYLHDLKKDTLFALDFSKLSRIRKKPPYMDTVGGTLFPNDRNLFLHDPVFAKHKPLALLDVRAADNKDRWIVLVDLSNGKITEIEHQQDSAWIGGPGISEWNGMNVPLGFLDKDEVVYFQSEESGYAQLYELNLAQHRKYLAYPGGEGFEIQSVELSSDGAKYFVIHNAKDPRTRKFACIDRIHRKMVDLIGNVDGGMREVAIAPNEQTWVYLYSQANHPWELYISTLGGKPKPITASTTPQFNAYPWRIPAYVQYTASDGQKVYARLYEPTAARKNGAAVLFVHGAGYLQNAHGWWSQYYREYLFHNYLVDCGYTVLDVDYRASAGYGRNYRTAIYRHMGGRDVQDFLDSKKFLATLSLDTNRVGIYGGSYGGFVTLMSLFQHPEAFACGAALRSVTDWAHYNHEYTSNILNYPDTDPQAYRKSSPIYFAEGLTKPLLMLHGMVDDNVQFQDIVRLQQRLIELGKTTWELAAYPVEAHGFTEAYSWYDEYRRIFELFERHLKRK